MARLTKKDVIHVAELSNLKLTDSEIKKFLPQLTKIVEFVGSLTEVNTENIEPTSQTTGLINVTREDKVISENMLTHEDYFKVKAIFQGKDK
ncbi:MAG: Asp-tRNA(Asn)/Glu-tRNA(Gln) amidotransferase subunit GatC [Patescibacteria group bacterium]